MENEPHKRAIARGFGSLKHKLLSNIGFAIIAIGTALPLNAAERISFYYGPLEFSVAVDDLETFARDGEANELAGYLNRFSPQQQEQFRSFLTASYPVDPVLVYRFSHTSVGERLLRRVGEIVNFPRGQNGFYGIRAALVQAATEPDGLTAINFLRHFPTDIQLNTEQTLKLIGQISTLQQETKRLVAQFKQMTLADSKPPTSLPDLRKPGPFRVSMQTLTLQDSDRDRQLVVDLYLPQSNSEIPVLVISNGLGAKRDRFNYLGQHLASYGFAVAIPDHPGSDDRRQKDFLTGLYGENFDATEFIERPQDITFLLDQLERLNHNQFKDRLNLQQVGVFGYSFGGATALSLSGALFDFEHLEKDCRSQQYIVNISLLYQCRALELPQQSFNLQDRRVKAVFVYVPFGNSLFGTGISRVTNPVMWQSSDNDWIAPLLIEQIPSFSSLAVPDKYLVVSEKLPHTPVVLPTNQGESLEKIRQVAQDYQNVLSVAFFKVYVAQDQFYRSYLQPSYMQVLSEDPYFLSLVQSISP